MKFPMVLITLAIGTALASPIPDEPREDSGFGGALLKGATRSIAAHRGGGGHKPKKMPHRGGGHGHGGEGLSAHLCREHCCHHKREPAEALFHDMCEHCHSLGLC
ncbi:hypothetical protein MAC_03612 [Metarhizium acridum CQMa 102]|uniref:Uncharacterized protein n=1 Tax=Metarhizium acridum (strain CQMa 102) TaxID=655827 RepID=E9E164_METAQ|nr:uncharacterized protein MAC_03612 [Metarhizium acridum CQMa 102]EFY90366.1 hypothetical protein MAC_03612 [Metarhizium acridum CQMa 102]